MEKNDNGKERKHRKNQVKSQVGAACVEEVGEEEQVSSIMIAGRCSNYVSLSERRWD